VITKSKSQGKTYTLNYIHKTKKAGKLVDKVLRQYGEPSMPLSQLRSLISDQLKIASLSALIVKDRESSR